MMDLEFLQFAGFGGLIMIIWWVLLVWGFVSFVRWMMNDSARKEKSAMDIAKERYARGEIDAIEFEEIKRNIKSSSH